MGQKLIKLVWLFPDATVEAVTFPSDIRGGGGTVHTVIHYFLLFLCCDVLVLFVCLFSSILGNLGLMQ